MGTYRYQYNWEFFKEDSEELYYFLGLVASDGYLSNDEIEIGLNEKDLHILERLRDLIVPEKPVNLKKNTNSYTLKISCRSKMKRFKDFFGMKTNQKHKEMRFPNVPKEYMKDFIRGYVDGDGGIDTTKGYRGDKVYVGPRLRILGNLEFLTVLNEMTKEIYPHKTNSILRKGKENVYIITYNFSTAKAILEWLYSDSKIYLHRKREKYLEVCS